MTRTPIDLSSLVGSRICHDLISPLGAISNGVELLALTGQTDGPEMELISQSVESAKARIRFFRISFGSSASDHDIGTGEIRSVLTDFSKASRTEITWNPDEAVPRSVAKLTFLLIQCLETAMPYGGKISVTHSDGTWTLSGTSDKLMVDPEIWGTLARPAGAVVVKASDVHFGLIPEVLSRMERTLVTEMTTTDISIRF